MKRRFRVAPEEGWLTLGLVLLICLTLAWSVDAVRWVVGKEDVLDYLVWAAAGGVLVGFIGPKVGWGRWLTYLVGALFAAILMPLFTGLVGAPEGSSLGDLFKRTSDATVAAFVDLVILREPATVQILHHVLVFGLIIWGTSMFASYAVFGHRRALNAVVIVGVLLVGNMTFDREDQLPLLVVYSLASLFLLIRTHVFDEQSEWLRRRIGDPASISSVYLRGGTAFIAITVLAAFLLTQTASSAPLAGAWGGVGDSLLSLSSALSKYLPTGGTNRSLGLTFGPDAQVRPDWFNNDAVAVVIKRDPTDDEDYYWRVASYDRISARGWSQSAVDTTDRAAGTRLLEGKQDDVDPTGLQNVKFQVIPDTFRDVKVISPATPVSVGEDVKVETVGQGGYYARIERSGGGPYQVNALVAVEGDEPGELNRGALLGAGKDYPAEIRSMYTALPAGMWGPNLEILKAKVLAAARTKEPIDIAQALERELRSSAYHYETDMHDVDCGTTSTAECFARVKRGFCQWYAPTMAVVLRNMSIPARIAQGFLPGARDKSTATEVIRNNNAHAWVEVYFPGYDWVRFDPTGGNLPGQAAPLPQGPADASPPPAPSAPSSSAGPLATLRLPRDFNDDPGGSVDPVAGGSIGPLVAIGLLLLVVVSIVAYLAWRRGPRGATSADAAYGMVTQIASRLGFGPRPNQTVYEYAGTLGDVLPDVRPELHTVAHAKVESIYAREVLGAERLQRVREAQRRLRVSLLRLAFRRKERRRRRH
jgi:hypothetical protein